MEDADAPGLERQAEQPPYAEPAVRAEGTEPELGGLDVQPEPEQRQPDDELGGPCLAGPPAKEESELDEPEDPKESQGGEAEAAEARSCAVVLWLARGSGLPLHAKCRVLAVC